MFKQEVRYKCWILDRLLIVSSNPGEDIPSILNKESEIRLGVSSGNLLNELSVTR